MEFAPEPDVSIFAINWPAQTIRQLRFTAAESAIPVAEIVLPKAVANKSIYVGQNIYFLAVSKTPVFEIGFTKQI